MKKVLSLFLGFVFVIGICVSTPITVNAASVNDLTFELNEDGKSYFVSDCSYEATGEVIIPESYNGLPVTKIGERALFNTPHITAISLPDSVLTISDFAFGECPEVEEITGLENVTSIGEGAFYGCQGLKAPIFPKNLSRVSNLAFAFCRGFESVSIPEYITEIGDSAFYNCVKLKKVQLHNGIKNIGMAAFANCVDLTDIELPVGLTEIPEDLFSCCLSLEIITIPDGVKTIGIDAFCSCESLTTIEIPGNVKVIPPYMFINCENLKSIVLPEGLTKISEYAFTNCESLEEVIFKGTETQWKAVEISSSENEYLTNANIVFEKQDITHKHNYTSKVTKQPTYTETGIKTFTCFCGDTYTEKIPKLTITFTTPKVTFKNTAKGIQVSWNAIENAESYIVYRSVYSGGAWTKWAAIKKGLTTTSYVDGTVKLGTQYKYTVRAVNGSVMSNYQNTKGLKYDVKPAVTIANASNGVKVTWTTVANATGYRVYSSTYNTKTKKWSGWKNRGTAKATATSWVDKSAKSGTQYKYTVKAMNNKVASSYNKTGASTLFLAQPTVKIANNASGMKVTWNKIAGSKGYTIYRAEYVNGKWSGWKNMGTIKNGSTVSWVDKSVKSGVTYRYTVRTINGSYKSTYKASSGLLYLAQPKTTVKAVSTGITVNWTQSAGSTGYTIYRMEYNAKTKKWSGWKNMGTAKADKKTWTDKSAKKGVTYRYTVKAVNGKVASTYKASGNVKR